MDVAATASADERARAQGRVRWELLVGSSARTSRSSTRAARSASCGRWPTRCCCSSVYTFVFQFVLQAGIPQFGFFLLSGLLVWNFRSARSAPRHRCGRRQRRASEEGPVPAQRAAAVPVGFALVHFGLQLLVLLAAMAVTGFTELRRAAPAAGRAGYRGRHHVDRCGLVLVAALNVRYRDTQHVVEVVLMAGFWIMPDRLLGVACSQGPLARRPWLR